MTSRKITATVRVSPDCHTTSHTACFLGGPPILQRTLFCLALGSLLAGGIQGCTMMKGGSSTVLPSSAYFPADAVEFTPLQAIAHAQDTRIKSCYKGPACDDAYYARGLVALFE